MKKQFKLVLACLGIMLLVLSSCSLEEALNTLAGNKYIEWGLVEVDTKHAEAATKVVDNSKPDESSKTAVNTEAGTLDISSVGSMKSINTALKDLDVEVSIKVGTDRAQSIEKNGILSAQSQEEKAELSSSLSQVLSGTANTTAFVSNMSQPATEQQSEAAKNSMAVVSSVIDSIQKKFEPTDESGSESNAEVNEVLNTLSDLSSQLTNKANSGEALTKAEVLQVQMITNLVTSAASVATVMNDSTIDTSNPATLMEQQSVKDLVADATLLSQTTKALSGNVDVITVPGLTDFISTMTGSSSDSDSSRALPRAGEGTDAGEGDGSESDTSSDWLIKTEDGNYKLKDAVDADMLGDNGELQAMFDLIVNMLDHVLGISVDKDGKVDVVKDYSVRSYAFGNLSSSYDVLFSVAKGTPDEINANRSHYKSMSGRATAGNALDFILATLVSSINDILADEKIGNESTTLAEVVKEFAELNDWFGGKIEEGDVIYLPATIVEKFSLNTIGEGDNPFKGLFKKKADTLLAKATTVDKMMAVGNFQITSILSMVGGSSSDMDTSKTMYDMLYEAFVDMGIKEAK